MRGRLKGMAELGLTPRFIDHFLAETESRWAAISPDPHVYGFQIQRGTKWKPGLAEPEIAAYQASLGIAFPDDLVTFLRHANGTNQTMKNIFGSNGDPPRWSAGVYSYPHDLDIVRKRIEWLNEDRQEALHSLELSGVSLGNDPQFIPFCDHRYLLSNGDPKSSIVCSIASGDAIVYGWSLRAFLEVEFLD